jgi:hypothetical protein
MYNFDYDRDIQCTLALLIIMTVQECHILYNLMILLPTLYRLAHESQVANETGSHFSEPAGGHGRSPGPARPLPASLGGLRDSDSESGRGLPRPRPRRGLGNAQTGNLASRSVEAFSETKLEARASGLKSRSLRRSTSEVKCDRAPCGPGPALATLSLSFKCRGGFLSLPRADWRDLPVVCRDTGTGRGRPSAAAGGQPGAAASGQCRGRPAAGAASKPEAGLWPVVVC